MSVFEISNPRRPDGGGAAVLPRPHTVHQAGDGKEVQKFEYLIIETGTIQHDAVIQYVCDQDPPSV
jgi:hypothetical protein